MVHSQIKLRRKSNQEYFSAQTTRRGHSVHFCECTGSAEFLFFVHNIGQTEKLLILEVDVDCFGRSHRGVAEQFADSIEVDVVPYNQLRRCVMPQGVRPEPGDAGPAGETVAQMQYSVAA